MSTSTSTQTTSSRSRRTSSGSVPLMAVGLSSTPSAPSASMAASDQDISASSSAAGPSFNSTISTLRSLYPRAARALVERDYALTQSLIESAFDLLSPPSEATPGLDALDTHRRKWDILRITLEASAYAEPPSESRKWFPASEVMPAALRANLLLSAPGVVTSLHKRSVRLFTPTSMDSRAAFLPAQILISLVYASLKLECPELARGMIEDWLAQRDSVESTHADVDGYARILELYCLNVLPQLHDLDYAKEFLTYERQLKHGAKERLLASLDELRREEMETARNIPSPPPTESSSSFSSRTASPSPSLSSTSSRDSLDTHSTRTVVPSRPKHGMNGFTPLASSSLSPVASNGTAQTPKRSSSPSSTTMTRTARTSAHPDSQRNMQPTTFLTIRKTILPFLERLGHSRFLLALLCVIVPFLSFVIQTLKGQGRGQKAISPVARRRLAGQQQSGVVRTVWREAVRAVSDAIRMAGSGLV